jgi:MYXO-CTERM domain-containing protein
MIQRILLTSLAAGAAIAAAYPQTAEACGGTFCDVGPTAMPVDQTGENILFIMDEGSVEAQIQIQYDPDSTAAVFAWVVPVTEVPTFAVGSDRLFTNLLNGTVPSYGFSSQFEQCGDVDGGGTGAGGGDTSGGGDSTGGGGGPEVVFEDTVGAFDIVVLSGGTASEVMDWLAANNYEQDPAAEPILEDYLSEGYLFAAFRLTNGAEVAEIHPISLTFQNPEACVPLRLTRIAAQEDMDVRTFFLSDNRVVPENYRHVLVNPLRLDWANFADNYKEVITLAVDADGADGHAFVTEYAGDSSVASQGGLYSPAWDAAPFQTALPVDVIDLLEAQGLVFCFDGGFGSDGGSDTGGNGPVCQYNHTLIRGLLQQYLPIPASVTEADFYGCLSCYEGLIDMAAWDGPAFAAAVQERVIDAGLHAEQLLTTYPYLTRMYTTISPAEMTADPFFQQNADLPDVDLTTQLATQFITCDNTSVWTLPDGREVYSPIAGTFPDFVAEMPWEEEIEDTPEVGAPLSIVDNTDLINTQLTEHNCLYNYPSPEACGNPPDGGDTDGGTGSGTGGGSAGTGGTGDGPGQDGDITSDGCQCTASGSPRGGALGFGLLALGLLGLRRRRQ